jgi:hypothetical protein
MSFARAGNLLVATASVAALAASIVATTPRTAAAEGDECGGHSSPVCKSTKNCVSVNGGTVTCTTDYYYYADAS